MRVSHCGGITIVETLVAIIIASILVAILLPAVQYSREASRRAHCSGAMRQIGVAFESYEAAHGVFPPGNAKGFSFLSAILPYAEQSAVYAAIDHSQVALSPANQAVGKLRMPGFRCPSDTVSYERVGVTNYAANHGTGLQAHGLDGLFGTTTTNGQSAVLVLRPADVTDGLSSTAAVAEILVADGRAPLEPLRSIFETPIPLLGPSQIDAFADACKCLTPAQPATPIRGIFWTIGDPTHTGYNHVLTPNNHSCKNGNNLREGAFTAASAHTGGVNVIFADGHLSFIHEAITRRLWRSLGSRNGGEASGSSNF